MAWLAVYEALYLEQNESMLSGTQPSDFADGRNVVWCSGCWPNLPRVPSRQHVSFVLTFSSPQISCWWSMLMAIQIFNCRPQPKLSYSHSNTLSALFGNGERYKDCPIQNLRGVSHSFCKFKFPALHRTGVTVSYIYLLQSPLSRSPLQPGHFAHRIPGTSTSSQALRRPFSQCPLH